MKWSAFILLQFALLAASQAQFGVERVQKLGFGFRLETHAEPTNSSFESIAHLQYLYYLDQKLCSPSLYSIAPSGRFAIYEDGSSGHLFLFRRADRRIRRLKPNIDADVRDFAWREDELLVVVRLEGGHPPQKFSLHWDN